MVEHGLAKARTRVRFPSLAPEMNLLELSSIVINIKFRNGFDFFVFRTSIISLEIYIQINIKTKKS